MGLRLIENVKSMSLAALIVIGWGVSCCPAEAAPTERLVVAGGCFWCVEADFEKVDGVIDVVSGFTGGTVENPTYKQVVRGGTGHFEAVEITFDAGVVSRERLLSLFFRSIDPTDDGGQFCDRGNTYRTAVFTDGATEKALAEKVRQNAQQELGQQIVTPVLEASEFFPADEYHQDFYKSKGLILTRFGPKSKASAYKAYRESCGRDERVKALWGESAPFAGS